MKKQLEEFFEEVKRIGGEVLSCEKRREPNIIAFKCLFPVEGSKSLMYYQECSLDAIPETAGWGVEFAREAHDQIIEYSKRQVKNTGENKVDQ